MDYVSVTDADHATEEKKNRKTGAPVYKQTTSAFKRHSAPGLSSVLHPSACTKEPALLLNVALLYLYVHFLSEYLLPRLPL